MVEFKDNTNDNENLHCSNRFKDEFMQELVYKCSTTLIERLAVAKTSIYRSPQDKD